MAIFEQTPGKVKQDKDFSQEIKHKERSRPHFTDFSYCLAKRQFTRSI
jgi:hypothetical protein